MPFHVQHHLDAFATTSSTDAAQTGQVIGDLPPSRVRKLVKDLLNAMDNPSTGHDQCNAMNTLLRVLSLHKDALIDARLVPDVFLGAFWVLSDVDYEDPNDPIFNPETPSPALQSLDIMAHLCKNYAEHISDQLSVVINDYFSSSSPRKRFAAMMIMTLSTPSLPMTFSPLMPGLLCAVQSFYQEQRPHLDFATSLLLNSWLRSPTLAPYCFPQSEALITLFLGCIRGYLHRRSSEWFVMFAAALSCLPLVAALELGPTPPDIASLLANAVPHLLDLMDTLAHTRTAWVMLSLPLDALKALVLLCPDKFRPYVDLTFARFATIVPCTYGEQSLRRHTVNLAMALLKPSHVGDVLPAPDFIVKQILRGMTSRRSVIRGPSFRAFTGLTHVYGERISPYVEQIALAHLKALCGREPERATDDYNVAIREKSSAMISLAFLARASGRAFIPFISAACRILITLFGHHVLEIRDHACRALLLVLLPGGDDHGIFSTHTTLWQLCAQCLHATRGGRYISQQQRKHLDSFFADVAKAGLFRDKRTPGIAVHPVWHFAT